LLTGKANQAVLVRGFLGPRKLTSGGPYSNIFHYVSDRWYCTPYDRLLAWYCRLSETLCKCALWL